MSNEIKQNFERRIDELINRIKALSKQNNDGTLDDTISDLCKYLCILLSGYFEKVLINQILKFTEHRTSKEIQHFLTSEIHHETNFNKKKLEELLNKFTTEWIEKLNAWIDYDIFCSSLGSLYGNRNNIAHGSNTSVGIQTLESNYNILKDFFEQFNSILHKSSS